MASLSKKKHIFVHICCAACASHVFSELENEGFTITGYFYNPVVHGLAEYKRRLFDVEKFCKDKGIKLIVPDYNIEEYFSLLLPYQDKNSIKYIADKKRYRRRRCQMCISLLINNLIEQAKKIKIRNITTTMLCSPFRDHDEIWNTGVDFSISRGVEFYYKDFRKGYWKGRNFARSHDFSVPKYCGCLESLEEGLLE